jgi:hypothetical protein
LARQTKPTDRVSFVLRLWLEADTEGPSRWSWRVHHVQTGEDGYFRSLGSVLDFVAERAGLSAPEIGSPDERFE